jgi:hypothetical protein
VLTDNDEDRIVRQEIEEIMENESALLAVQHAKDHAVLWKGVSNDPNPRNWTADFVLALQCDCQPYDAASLN